MASLQEKVRVNRAHSVRNNMTDYGNPRDYDLDEYEEQRDRIKTKLARVRFQFEKCCECGHTDKAFEHAIDLAYWQTKLTKISKKVTVTRQDFVLRPLADIYHDGKIGE